MLKKNHCNSDLVLPGFKSDAKRADFDARHIKNGSLYVT